MAEMPFLASLPRVAEEVLTPDALDQRLTEVSKPFVVRGLAAHWPLVKAAEQGSVVARDYLRQHQKPRPFSANIGAGGDDERLTYDSDGVAMAFRMEQGPLDRFLDAMATKEGDPSVPTIYLSSTDMRGYFDGLAQANTLPLGKRQPLESIWIGTRTCVPAHNDVPHNLAVCAAGRRRFTLFPPEQFANLYLGPLDNTPAGRAVGMPDLRAPDFVRYPRLRDALATAQIAELEPGDAVFIPSLWWHHVEGLAPFNILVNYWWRDEPAYLGHPEDALLHAILALRELPVEQRTQWRALFDHYVFAPDANAHDYIPAAARGILAPLTPETAGRLRARLLRGLSR